MKKWLFVVLTILFCSLQYRLWEGDGSIQDVIRLSKAIHSENEEVKNLAQRNKQLLTEVQAIKAYPEALEERARLEHGMVKQGETFYLILDRNR